MGLPLQFCKFIMKIKSMSTPSFPSLGGVDAMGGRGGCYEAMKYFTL